MNLQNRMWFVNWLDVMDAVTPIEGVSGISGQDFSQFIFFIHMYQIFMPYLIYLINFNMIQCYIVPSKKNNFDASAAKWRAHIFWFILSSISLNQKVNIYNNNKKNDLKIFASRGVCFWFAFFSLFCFFLFLSLCISIFVQIFADDEKQREIKGKETNRLLRDMAKSEGKKMNFNCFGIKLWYYTLIIFKCVIKGVCT